MPDEELSISLAEELLCLLKEKNIERFLSSLKLISKDSEMEFLCLLFLELHGLHWSSGDLLYLDLVLLDPGPQKKILVKRSSLV